MDAHGDRMERIEARIVALEEGPSGRARRFGGRRRRTALIAAALGIALVLPGVALANHLFSDVPTGSPFHGQIESLAAAGVTTGCGGGRFCPADPVRRDAMAAFLTRGLGRLAVAVVPSVTPDPTETHELIVETGIQTVGLGYLHAIATFEVWFTSTGQYPCEGRFFLSVDGETVGEAAHTIVSARMNSAPTGHGTLALTGQAVRIVEQGTDSVGLVWNSRNTGTCGITVMNGLLSATVVPFGWNGASPE